MKTSPSNPPRPPHDQVRRKDYVAGLLELACQELELPPSRFDAAKRAYESVGDWLGKCPNTGHLEPRIFPQGSMALGTTVRPLEREEFDVDLVCHLQQLDTRANQAEVKMVIGRRLEAYEQGFGPELEEYKRCWRLNYAEESMLHLDITPAVRNPDCANDGLAVTDNEKRRWEPTHPQGYIEWFEKRAELQPRVRSRRAEFAAKEAAVVEPLPENQQFKGLLKRSVQLLKRHRSIVFAENPELAPISVIITTLAATAYEELCMQNIEFETELDVLLATVERLPSHVERRRDAMGRGELWVPNATTAGENFAEKWNRNQNLPNAFMSWQRRAFQDFKAIAEAEDAEKTLAALENCVGTKTAACVRATITKRVSGARTAGALRSDSRGAVNLSIGTSIARNTFFGS